MKLVIVSSVKVNARSISRYSELIYTKLYVADVQPVVSLFFKSIFRHLCAKYIVYIRGEVRGG